MAKIVQPQFPKKDKRLLGVWKSDKKRTFAEWHWKKNTSPKKKAKLMSLFGKLEVTYTHTKLISTLRYRKWEQARRYVILGMDDESVAIATFGELEIKDRRKYDRFNLKYLRELFPSKVAVVHIHFDKEYYWISLGKGRNREFFRKISDGK